MRGIAFALACVAMSGVVGGCELLVGIKDKSSADSDAGEGSDAGPDPSLPCAQQPPGFLFCDDFDFELEAGDTWQWDTPLGGATIDLDDTDSRTPPSSARFTVPAPPAQGQLGRPVGTPTTRYRFAFDLRVDVPDLSTLPQVGVAQAYRDTGTDQLSVNYVLGPSATAMAQVYIGAGMQLNVPLKQLPPLRTWTRIVLAYDAVQGLTVVEDGVTIGTSPEAAHGPPGSTSIIVGAVYSNPPGSAPFVVEIDDVVVRGD